MRQKHDQCKSYRLYTDILSIQAVRFRNVRMTLTGSSKVSMSHREFSKVLARSLEPVEIPREFLMDLHRNSGDSWMINTTNTTSS